VRVVSLNLGAVGQIEVRGSRVASGIHKTPAVGPQELGEQGFAGDARVDRASNRHYAVYAYPLEHYAGWARLLGREGFPHGQFGENLTVEGLTETDARIGDVLRFGTAVLQVSLPRIPCRKLDARMGAPLAPAFLESRRVGFYLRVLEPGRVAGGDALELLESDPGSPSVDELVRLSQLDYWDADGLERLLASPFILPAWREALEDKRRRGAAVEGWLGLRELEVSARLEHGQDFFSLRLRCPRGRPLPRFRAGQSLMVTARRNPLEPRLRDSFPLSGDPRAEDSYRITLRAAGDDPADAATLARHLEAVAAPGLLLRCGPPRGEAVLDAAGPDADGLLLVADVSGLALALAVAYEWVPGETRPLGLLHCSAEGGVAPLRDEVEALMARAPGLELVPCANAESGDLHPEVSRALERWLSGRRPFVVGCGSGPFLAALESELRRLGVAPERARRLRWGG